MTGDARTRARIRAHSCTPTHTYTPLIYLQAGISVCAGGIIGLGEGHMDRIGLFHQLATLPAHPESVPINALVAVKGTPFQDHEAPTGLDIARCVATARILMPKTVVRLSAGRMNFSFSDQALCFLAGANSIFDGDKLLTTPNNDRNEDLEMFDMLGLRSRPAFLPYESGQESSKEEFTARGGAKEETMCA
jgi:biotin synthase